MVYARSIVRGRPKKRPSMTATRRALFYACKTLCSYCRRKTEMPSVLRPAHALTATVEHIVPLSRGGAMRGDNITLACSLCNGLKGNMTPQEWTEFMIANPGWWRKAAGKIVPVAETKMIRREGKKAWRIWRQGQENVRIPTSVPVEYDDPIAQAAFEGVYKNRLHMLRVPTTTAGDDGHR